MSYPMRISIHVPDTQYYIEVDYKKAECNKEPAHCHVFNAKGVRLAQIWLKSRTFKTIPNNISSDDCSKIIRAVSIHRYEIEEAYIFNSRNGLE